MGYTTIPVRREVKERLEKLKGARDWSEFLSDVAEEILKIKREDAFHRLREIASDHLDRIEESSREFRRGGFSLGARGH